MSNHEVTTTELMEFLVEHMATKADLAFCATKEDLKGFATKEDLKGFATKQDLERFATKQDLLALEYNILDRMDDKLADLKSDLVLLLRKEDTKLVALIELMQQKYGMDEKDARALLRMQPFPQT